MKIWLRALTYIPFKYDNIYLFDFIDVFTSKLIGFMDTSIRYPIIIDAFLQNLGKEHPEEGLINHTYHDSQYTGFHFQDVLRKNDLYLVMRRKGNPYYNTLMGFFYF